VLRRLAWSSIPSPSFSAAGLDDIAGVAIAVLAISGTIGIVLAIPPSIASVGDDGGKIVRAVSSSPLTREPARDSDAVAGKPTNHRSRAPCAECGVVTSIRRIERSGASEGQDASRADNRAGDGKSAGSAMSGDVPAGARYEVTVRFRDGSTAMFVEDLPRSLPLGGRVIVIGRSDVTVD
jgi:hypothetical protein